MGDLLKEYEFQDCFLLQEEREPHEAFYNNYHHYNTDIDKDGMPLGIEILAGEARCIVPRLNNQEEESK